MWRDDGYLLDILDAAHSIQVFTAGVDEKRFCEDDLLQSGVIRKLEIIGEAAGRVSTEFVVDHPAIPWRQMVSMRNRLIHEYTKVRMELVWQAVQADIPALVELITPLVEDKEK
jgi:uncharacterized protein with HEPN domain